MVLGPPINTDSADNCAALPPVRGSVRRKPRSRWIAAECRRSARLAASAAATDGDATMGRPMIFVDYLGPVHHLPQVSEVVRREVGAAMRVRPELVAVRRIATDDARDEIEVWIELSTDEQLYRLGKDIAQRISAGLRPNGE